MDDEKQFIRQLSRNKPDLDKPEIAVEFARLLISHRRYNDAILIVRTALEEGPRYDLYELRACTTHNALGDLWVEANRLAGKKPEKNSAEIYNERGKPEPDWKERLQQLNGT